MLWVTALTLVTVCSIYHVGCLNTKCVWETAWYKLYRREGTNITCDDDLLRGRGYCWFFVSTVDQELLVLILLKPRFIREATLKYRLQNGSYVTRSSVDLFVTEKLETALQLRDASNASWDAIRHSGAWRRIAASGNGSLPLTSFLVIPNVQQYNKFSDIYLNLEGEEAEILAAHFDDRLSNGRRTLYLKFWSNLRCNVWNCTVWRQDGSHRMEASHSNYFHHTLLSTNVPVSSTKMPSSIGSITCFASSNYPSNWRNVTFNRMRIPRLSVSEVRMSGKSAKVSLVHDWTAMLFSCGVASRSGRIMSLIDCSSSRVSQTGNADACFRKRRLDNQTVELTTNISVTMDLFNAEVICLFKLLSHVPEMFVSYTTVRDIGELTDACETDVDLGSSRYWREGELRQIRVTSRNCSIWSVSHTCWLTDACGKRRDRWLRVVQQNNFSSIHELRVSRWMGQRDWLVRCSVSQSGVAHSYDDVESPRVQKPDVFYRGEVTVMKIFVTEASMRFVLFTLGRPVVTVSECYVRQLNGSVINFQLVQKPNTTDAQQLWTFEGPKPGDASVFVHCMTHQSLGTETLFEKDLIFPIPLDSPAAVLLPSLLSSLATAVVVAVMFAIIKKRRTLARWLQGQQTREATRQPPLMLELPQRSGLRYAEDNGAYTYAEVETVGQSPNTDDRPTAAAASEATPPVHPRQFEEDAEYLTEEPQENASTPAVPYINMPV